MRNAPGMCEDCHRNASDIRQENYQNVSLIRRNVQRNCIEYVRNVYVITRFIVFCFVETEAGSLSLDNLVYLFICLC